MIGAFKHIGDEIESFVNRELNWVLIILTCILDVNILYLHQNDRGWQ